MTLDSKSLPDPPLRGHLVIFVDGYKMRYSGLFHVFSDGHRSVSVPDSLVPPPDHEVGSDEWWQDGWAVGDNPRNRLCKRLGMKALRRFDSFDEAVDFMFARQRKHKDQRHTLVYVTTGLADRERMSVVRSLDDIEAIEAEIAAELAAHEAAMSEQRAATEAEHPCLRVLQEKYGKAAGWALSDFLNEVREKGADVVKATMPTSSFYRQMKKLREAGVGV